MSRRLVTTTCTLHLHRMPRVGRGAGGARLRQRVDPPMRGKVVVLVTPGGSGRPSPSELGGAV